MVRAAAYDEVVSLSNCVTNIEFETVSVYLSFPARANTERKLLQGGTLFASLDPASSGITTGRLAISTILTQ